MPSMKQPKDPKKRVRPSASPEMVAGLEKRMLDPEHVKKVKAAHGNTPPGAPEETKP
jgi:hypothetical protein